MYLPVYTYSSYVNLPEFFIRFSFIHIHVEEQINCLNFDEKHTQILSRSRNITNFIKQEKFCRDTIQM